MIARTAQAISVLELRQAVNRAGMVEYIIDKLLREMPDAQHFIIIAERWDDDDSGGS